MNKPPIARVNIPVNEEGAGGLKTLYGVVWQYQSARPQIRYEPRRGRAIIRNKKGVSVPAEILSTALLWAEGVGPRKKPSILARSHNIRPTTARGNMQEEPSPGVQN